MLLGGEEAVRGPFGKWLVVAVCGLTALGCRTGEGGLRPGKPGQVGMSKQRLNRVRDIVSQAVEDLEIPGAVVLVARKKRIVLRQAFGDAQWVPFMRPMEASMVFDLASLTKPLATAASIMILVDQGRISLRERVKDFIPEFQPFLDEEGRPSDDARIWHLMTHTSGLPALIEEEEAAAVCGDPCSTQDLALAIAGLPKTAPPGETFQYSCLGYITLAAIIERVTGESIARFAGRHIFEPLGMESTGYVPDAEMRARSVPTEVVGDRLLTGVVHDPLARLQGGVSGNAGLFSNADDLAVFAQMMLGGGVYRGVRILSPLAVLRMTSIDERVRFSGRGLGWDLDSSYSSNGGDLFGPNSFGHTGYTGTSIWIDPETETFLVLLTNRVHPDDGGNISALRARVANVVAGSIIRR